MPVVGPFVLIGMLAALAWIGLKWGYQSGWEVAQVYE